MFIVLIFGLFGFLMGAVFGFVGAPVWATTVGGIVCGFLASQLFEDQ
jgi:hypothetical protein